MSSYPPTFTRTNVQKRFDQYLNQTYPLQERLDLYQQNNQTPQGVSPNALIGPPELDNKRSGPMKHVIGPMISKQSTLDKRHVDDNNPSPSGTGDSLLNIQVENSNNGMCKKKKKLADKILPQNIRDVPESQAYMDLLAFEKNLDSTIMKKRLDIQEALKRPMKQQRKLRLSITNTIYPAKKLDDNEKESVTSWDLRIEGFLLEDAKNEPNKIKRKFSSFFKSLVIEFDKNIYGPHNHLVEWNRTATTQETDGFQVKRSGDKNVWSTIILLLDYQPLQFKLDHRLARLLGIHTQTRPFIIKALWQFIKTHKLQDSHEKEYINCDKYLQQIFNCSRMKFVEIPQKLNTLLHPPDPIVINHMIRVAGVSVEQKQTVIYDINVEVDDTLKGQMNNFLLSNASQQELQSLDNKIYETIKTLNQLKINKEFFLDFASNPQRFMYEWMISQSRDLKTITDVVGNPEEERRTEFYSQPWTEEAVKRYIYFKNLQKQTEIEHKLDIHNS